MDTSEIIKAFALLWAVIDPIGTVPVFMSVTRKHSDADKPKIALRAVLIATGVLVFFLVAGQFMLDAMEVPLDAFQVAGGIILFLFALTMIFGESKPEQEVELSHQYKETAIFPLAIPCIASPGAMMAIVLLTDNHRFSIPHQIITGLVMLVVLFISYLLLLGSRWIYRRIGDAGASILSRIMGMLLASVAASSVLAGIKEFFTH